MPRRSRASVSGSSRPGSPPRSAAHERSPRRYAPRDTSVRRCRRTRRSPHATKAPTLEQATISARVEPCHVPAGTVTGRGRAGEDARPAGGGDVDAVVEGEGAFRGVRLQPEVLVDSSRIAEVAAHAMR